MVAHELAHVRTRDVLTQTLAVMLADDARSSPAGSAAGSRALLLFVLAPVAAAFVHLLLSPKREFAADAHAAASAIPHDLADALLRLDRAARARGVRAIAGDRAALHRQPVRRDRSDLPHVRDTPAGRGARRSPARLTGHPPWRSVADQP